MVFFPVGFGGRRNITSHEGETKEVPPAIKRRKVDWNIFGLWQCVKSKGPK